MYTAAQLQYAVEVGEELRARRRAASTQPTLGDVSTMGTRVAVQPRRELHSRGAAIEQVARDCLRHHTAGCRDAMPIKVSQPVIDQQSLMSVLDLLAGPNSVANALVARFNPSSAVAVDLLASRPRRIVTATPPRYLEACADANAAN